MTIDTKDMLNSILSSIARIDYVKPEDIPNIDLYMDQVTTFMEEQLSSTKRHEEDKILTKTMINNYAKNHLLPPPVKKKYSREHVLVMIFIYYFKNILSIKDIETMLAPVTKEYFGSGGQAGRRAGVSAALLLYLQLKLRRLCEEASDRKTDRRTAGAGSPGEKKEIRPAPYFFSFACTSASTNRYPTPISVKMNSG